MRGTRQFVALCVFVVAGCGSESPPYATLPLRDTLRAEPQALLTLSPEERRNLAERFEHARTTHAPPLGVQLAPDSTPEQAALVVDRARGADDALIAYTLWRGFATPFVETPSPSPGALEALTVEGVPPTDTADDEMRAMEGNAGRVVRATMRAAGAGHVIRVAGWPTAVMALGDAVYVNAAWLVVMAPEAPVATPMQGTGASPVPRAPSTVFTLQGSPDAGSTPPPTDAGARPPSTGGSGSGCGRDCCGGCSGSDCSGCGGCGGCSGCSEQSCCRQCSGGTCSVAPRPDVPFTVSRVAALLAPMLFALVFAFARKR